MTCAKEKTEIIRTGYNKKSCSVRLNISRVKHVNIQNLCGIFLMMSSLAACEALGAEGNVGIGIVVAVLAVIALGGIAFKLLGGILKIGIWGVVVLVLLVIGFIAFIIFKSMG